MAWANYDKYPRWLQECCNMLDRAAEEYKRTRTVDKSVDEFVGIRTPERVLKGQEPLPDDASDENGIVW